MISRISDESHREIVAILLAFVFATYMIAAGVALVGVTVLVTMA